MRRHDMLTIAMRIQRTFTNQSAPDKDHHEHDRHKQ
jgi:hypothetical protein